MATYKHIRSSTANKRPTTAIADGQIAINTNTASPGLFFKDSAGTGIVKVGPVHVGTAAPNSTPGAGGSTGNYKGEQWLDTSLTPAQLKVWNGSQWIGVVADELPVSKLQDGAARQLLQTDAAGTGVEWTNNVDVPGTLDVTSTATFDSIARHPVGSAAAPTITFTGDTNTGIYSPGADQVALSTNGVQRINIEADGDINIDSGGVFYNATNNRLGIGDNGPDSTLTVKAATGVTPFKVSGPFSEFARIDTSGRLLIGTPSAVADASTVSRHLQILGISAPTAGQFIARFDNGVNSPSLVLGKSRGATVGSFTVVNSGDQIGRLAFDATDGTKFVNAALIAAEVDGTPNTDDMPGRIVLSTTPDGNASPVERMRIKSSGIINFSNAPVYADNTAALAGGLVAGDVYRKSDGTLMITY